MRDVGFVPLKSAHTSFKQGRYFFRIPARNARAISGNRGSKAEYLSQSL
jgi:hypothetical protein